MRQLLYIFDPLCGWCYGFSPVVKKINQHYAGHFDISVLCGGLAIGDNALPVRKVAGYISGALGQVERMTGVRFGDGFVNGILRDENYIYNSEPPCIALTVVKELAPEHIVSFAHDVQTAFFYDGKNLNDAETYIHLLEPYGIDSDVFLKKYFRDEYKNKTYIEFDYCRDIGVRGYPALVLNEDGEHRILVRGYQTYENISALLDNTINKKNNE